MAKDVTKKIVIAVDGPAASGKGTLAKALAAKLGFAYLDTGSVYRAVALATLESGGDPAKLEDVLKVLDSVTGKLDSATLSNPKLRLPEVSNAAAKVAAMPEVRHAVRDFQTEFTKNPPDGAPGAVLDGRDIGTVVCPDADVKLYVTAAPEERARRRFEELKGKNPALTLEKVLEDLNDRDHHDSSRKVSPLRAADDAHILDTTALDRTGALDAALAIVHAKFPPEGSSAGAKKNFKPAP